MAKNKVNMPMGSAGLTRYFDEYKSKISFKPGYVIIFVIIVILIIAILHFLMSGIMGV
jgi:preprotein translocase subunit Sec61beta